MKKLLILCVAISCGILGCGSTEGALNTSTATATVDTLILDSDVASWVDATGAQATACAATSFPAVPEADSVNVTVSLTTNANSTSNALSARVEKATIYFTPANAVTPALSPVYQVIGQIVKSGGSLTIPVRVATQEQKILYQPALNCTSTIYNYFVTIALDVSEVGGKNTTINTAMQLRFADYVDK